MDETQQQTQTNLTTFGPNDMGKTEARKQKQKPQHQAGNRKKTKRTVPEQANPPQDAIAESAPPPIHPEDPQRMEIVYESSTRDVKDPEWVQLADENAAAPSQQHPNIVSISSSPAKSAPPSSDGWRASLITNKSGEPLGNLANCIAALHSEAWKGVLAYDLNLQRVVAR